MWDESRTTEVPSYGGLGSTRNILRDPDTLLMVITHAARLVCSRRTKNRLYPLNRSAQFTRQPTKFESLRRPSFQGHLKVTAILYYHTIRRTLQNCSNILHSSAIRRKIETGRRTHIWGKSYQNLFDCFFYINANFRPEFHKNPSASFWIIQTTTGVNNRRGKSIHNTAVA